MILATIYCQFTEYHWSAQMRFKDLDLRTTKRTHGSARQAADEILEMLREATGNKLLGLQRLQPKVYAITTKEEK